MLFRALLILAQVIALRVRGSLAAATFLEGFFATDRSPFHGSVYSLCYGVKAIGNIVSLANNKETSCEALGGLSFWQAQRESPSQYLNPDFEYFSFDTISGDSIMMIQDKLRAVLKVGRAGKNPGFKKAIFSPMVPKSIAGGGRGIRPGDHLVFIGSIDRPGQYKLEGGVITGLGGEPKGVFYTTKKAIEPTTMTLRVAPNPEPTGQDNLPIYEESDETDETDEYVGRAGIPAFNPTTETWEWAGLDPNPPTTAAGNRNEAIPEVSQETSDGYIEQADWSTGNVRHDFRLLPPNPKARDPYKLPAGFRYAQTGVSSNNPQTEETLQISDVQINPLQSTEETSRFLGESDQTERLFMNSQEDTALDSTSSQLNLGAIPYTPPGYGSEVSTGFPAGSEDGTGVNVPQRWVPPQDFSSNQKQAIQGYPPPPNLVKPAVKKAGAVDRVPLLPWPSASGNTNY
ncbi:hypothetical protein TWF718_003510 [Orbilia javanica]|uniref:Uncharacterized protein n=1 Tax=Orbilia javanica TaxID=47235 RepID=A0AAN8MIT3_9PEZI